MASHDGNECESENPPEGQVANSCILGRRTCIAGTDSQSERERCHPSETEKSGRFQICVKIGEVLQPAVAECRRYRLQRDLDELIESRHKQNGELARPPQQD